MKSILLTTTAIVAFAGAAAADGHVTMTWSGAATAGIARDGGSAAGAPSTRVLGTATTAIADAIAAQDADVGATPIDTNGDGEINNFDVVLVEADATANPPVVASNIHTVIRNLTAGVEVVAAAETVPPTDAVNIADGDTPLTADELAAVRALLAAGTAEANANLTGAAKAAQLAEVANVAALLDAVYGAAEVATGDFDTYAEVNATVTGSVALSNGVTVTAAMSVDAGTGYDFADDDGFDAAKTNGAALDFVTIDAGAMGALTFDKNDIAHLVDGDDDETGDIKYTNNLGIATVEVVMDLATDTDVVASRNSIDFEAAEAATATTEATLASIVYNEAVAADVAWSAKVSAPVADIATVYAAFDEEGGNAVGGSATIEGVTITVDSALEALQEELGEARSNTIGASYTAAGLTVGGAYNTVDDGNQWSINAAYAADGFSVAYSTNQGEEWSATAAYELSENASIEAGVNYTEDAFVGVAFNF